ncbi:hypothetical protein [Nocardioides yefusunii]|uniref:Uncharacterized protein n=1 Tax=Nocardioides yefusunii TaxID=2500546 RepID=A0ABW1QTB1_9ACTN|nr:hypothetical protein [Nocardioides yefusunii]
MESEAVLHPDPVVLRRFWETHRAKLHLNDLEAYQGVSGLQALTPGAWSYGATRAEADDFVTELLTQGSVTLVTPLDAYGDEDLPVAGTLSILCDGEGRPAVILVVDAVDVSAQAVAETLRAVVGNELR